MSHLWNDDNHMLNDNVHFHIPASQHSNILYYRILTGIPRTFTDFRNCTNLSKMQSLLQRMFINIDLRELQHP